MQEELSLKFGVGLRFVRDLEQIKEMLCIILWILNRLSGSQWNRYKSDRKQW